ncbi:MAG: FtsK/SpoIIIE domain-containing protein [Alphaproteobacteria bacterium]|nr:FtsK/SpoIIIE domain-containing protein [Alphaproteobacteria bacterium]
MPQSTRFLPESLSNALKSFASRAFGVALLCIGVMLIFALIRHNPWLTGFMSASDAGRQSLIGNIISFLVYGIGSIPIFFAFLYLSRIGAVMTFGWGLPSPEYNALRAFIAVALGAGGLGVLFPGSAAGGLVGVIVHSDLSHILGYWGAFAVGIILLSGFLIMAGLLLHIKWRDISMVARAIADAVRGIASALHLRERDAPNKDEEEEEEYEEEEEEESPTPQRKKSKAQSKKAPAKAARTSEHDYQLPPPEFLEKSAFYKHAVTADLKRTAAAMETSFEQYGIFGSVMGIKPGPIVTLYEFEPADGMRIKNITDTVKDMTRAMATERIRIAPIPRTKYVGVEMVNMDRQIVRFQSLITNPDFINSRYHLPLALGVDIGGHPVYFDLAKMPHCLIAGRTGSGKSVFVQSIIMSVVYHFLPDECKLIIVDPKGVDFTLWHDIPHLLTPIVTDASQAVNALKWTVREMEDRYKKLKDVGVQNVEGYNEAVAELRAKGKTITKQVPVGTDPETGALEFEEREVDLTDIPYLVVIIDEVADLMSVARKEVEACVQRLAQKARAAGIHLVMATQRPDTSVITGVIKANFPTRISFQARSNIDSMTTLGEKGAEQLLSCGDMLFSEAGRVPVRIHGAFIENKEINRVADFLRAEGEPEYVEGVGDNEGEEFSGASFGGDAPIAIPGMPRSKAEKDGDAYRQAVEYVVRDKKPTISYIQRRLGVGYNKAATFIERMEAEGIVSPPDANNKRHIL